MNGHAAASGSPTNVPAGSGPHRKPKPAAPMLDAEASVACSRCRTADSMLREAEKIGPATIALFEAILKAKRHPEQGFRLTG